MIPKQIHTAITKPMKNKEPAKYRDRDVLCGRGGLRYTHMGNRLFRRLVQKHKIIYRNVANRRERQILVESIVLAVQRVGGRFIKFMDSTKTWEEIDHKTALEKTYQALREPIQKRQTESQIKAPTAREGHLSPQYSLHFHRDVKPSSGRADLDVKPSCVRTGMGELSFDLGEGTSETMKLMASSCPVPDSMSSSSKVYDNQRSFSLDGMAVYKSMKSLEDAYHARRPWPLPELLRDTSQQGKLTLLNANRLDCQHNFRDSLCGGQGPGKNSAFSSNAPLECNQYREEGLASLLNDPLLDDLDDISIIDFGDDFFDFAPEPFSTGVH